MTDWMNLGQNDHLHAMMHNRYTVLFYKGTTKEPRLTNFIRTGTELVM